MPLGARHVLLYFVMPAQAATHDKMEIVLMNAVGPGRSLSRTSIRGRDDDRARELRKQLQRF